MAYTLAQIAHIETDFPEKFGIPRQSGLVEELRARIVFEPEFRSPDAVRGLDGYDYIWLVWQFSTVVQAGQDGTNWRPTVRPPRLGGNTRMGVFATRSPFRPNALGLSSVKLLKVEPNTPQGPVLTVGGADLLDGTPIFDIKPYLPYVDAHPDARGGFTDTTKFYTLQVQAKPEVLEQILRGGADKVMEAGAVLAGGHTINDKEPKYGLCVTGYVHPGKMWKNYGAEAGDTLILTKPLGCGILNTAIKAEMAGSAAAIRALSWLGAKRVAESNSMVFSCCEVLAGQVGMPLCCGFPVRAKARTASKICCSSCGVTPEMLAEGTSSVLWKTNGISEQCHGARPPSMAKS